MQGKGLIKSFLILLAIVTAIQFLYLLPTRSVESDAAAYGERLADNASASVDKDMVAKQGRIHYLDSMSSEDILTIPMLKSYTYDELKKQQLKLGLDLKGGMSIFLQVDLEELMKALSNDSKDATFLKALANAKEAQKDSQADYVSLFVDEYTKLSNGKKLASVFLRNQGMREKINTQSTNVEVAKILRDKADETVKLTFNRLKLRIDKLGVAQPNISLDEARDMILVELPGIENPERGRAMVGSQAKLEFWDTYEMSDQSPNIFAAFVAADKKLKSLLGGVDDVKIEYDTTYNYNYDELGNVTDSTQVINKKEDAFDNTGPLFKILDLNGGNGQMSYATTVMGLVDKNKKKQVEEYLARPEIKSLFPRNAKFLWSQQPHQDYATKEYTKQYELYMIKMLPGTDKAQLEGDVIVNASQSPDPTTGEPTVSLSMNSRGAKKWADMTTKAANPPTGDHRKVAIVLDDEVVSCPRVMNPITGGRTSITGNFSVQEAVDLSSILEVGKLPAKTRIIQESTVGPSLGAKNIRTSMIALIVGFLLVFLFMMFYYGGAGIVSVVALLVNLFFIFGALASIGTVLTLPGIAGIVLTIGMSVDANVIIFERIREELRAGKGKFKAIADGFKYSYSAIIDANVTTLLVAFVLSYFGLGPIKGFAVVLIIGVLSSLLTAVVMGRMLIEWHTGKGKDISFWTGMSEKWFSNMKIDWIGKRKIGYAISGVLLLLSIASIFTKGFDLGVDFKGGYSYNIEFPQDMDVNAETLREGLTEYFGSSPVVKAVDVENTYNIVTSHLIKDQSDDASRRVVETMLEGLNKITGKTITYKSFTNADAKNVPHITSSSKVGATIADDIQKSSTYAGGFALLFIFLYIFVRFTKWQYSLGAVAALFHDSIIVLGLFSLLHGIVPWSLEIDQAFVAALLTVIGYSINDTVVIFDRIREFFGIYHNKAKDEVFNLAINSTFSRTIVTSLTTLFVVAILFIFGGSTIKGFAFALLIGILVGTYSSIFIATPIVRDLTDKMNED